MWLIFPLDISVLEFLKKKSWRIVDSRLPLKPSGRMKAGERTQRRQHLRSEPGATQLQQALKWKNKESVCPGHREKQSFPRTAWSTQSGAAFGSSAWRPGKHPFRCHYPTVISNVVSTVSPGLEDKSQVLEAERWVGSEEELKGSSVDLPLWTCLRREWGRMW